MKKINWKLATCFYVLSLLSACANNNSQTTSNVPTLPLEQVINQCLAVAARQGGPTPTQSSLTEAQWVRYVTCAIGSNLRVAMDQVRDNPTATVEIQLGDDGTVNSIKRLQTSGNAVWDRAVDRSIGAAPALMPAPAMHRFSKLDVSFKPFPTNAGAAAGISLSGQSHWSMHECTTAGNAKVCN
jgi:hypothetical protein